MKDVNKPKETGHEQQNRRWVWLAGGVLVGFCLLIGQPLTQVNGQSGRGQNDPKKQKNERPPLPNPIPKIRLPENTPTKDEGDTLRINSDLITIVTTIAKKSPDAPLELGKDDFEILEDGVPQDIANFARDAELPVQIVMLFDTSLSVAQRLNFERKAAAKFFERVLRAQDRAALFSVSTDVVVLQDFTNRITMLTQALRQLKAQGATSLYDGIFLASEYLKDTKGRRAIIIVSDGGDTTSNKNLLEALTRVQQTDAVIFAVYTGNLAPSQNLRDLAAERALETLTNESGGEVFRPRITPGTQGEEADELSLKELDRTFVSLADQIRTQFVLGFFSTNEKRDGAFRKLTVRVKKPGFTARSRTGYYAPKS